jgi:hypothetical protein
MFNKSAAIQLVNDLCKKHRIKIVGYSTTSSGWAKHKKREIKIPNPTNVDRLGVCLHEIKHIVDGNKGKQYEKEFNCDLWALEQLKQLGYDTQAWERRMRWHVLSRIAMAANRGLVMSKLSDTIKSFFPEVDWNNWIGNKVFVRYSKTNEIGYTIEYTVNLSREEIEARLCRRGLILDKSMCDDATYGQWIVTGNNLSNTFGNLSEIVQYFKLTV